MNSDLIVLVGGPDSGKTNYLARLWEALRHGGGALVAPQVPDEIQYVEGALAHLLEGAFAPRSSKGAEHRNDVRIPLRVSDDEQASIAEMVVPDVNGELWKGAVESGQIDQQWMDLLTKCTGALLFVRVLSELNVQPLDWVTSARLLKHRGALMAEHTAVPTQVMLCELLRFLETTMTGSPGHGKPRVSVVITAWDRLDRDRASAGPMAYLRDEYPLFAAKLKDVEPDLITQSFGVSIVGGDLDVDDQFREQFLESNLADCGYVVSDTEAGVARSSDLTLPIAWLLNKSG